MRREGERERFTRIAERVWRVEKRRAGLGVVGEKKSVRRRSMRVEGEGDGY